MVGGGGGCTVIVINKDNGSHSAHKQRQTGQGGGEGRGGVRETEGERGGQDAMGCALLCLNEEKQLSHTPPPSHLRNKKDK